MVEPVSLTIGAVVAALVTKAAEKSGEELGTGVASVVARLTAWLGARFAKAGDKEAAEALAAAEEVPDSPSRTAFLAAILDSRANADAGFRAELERQVAEARASGVEVKAVTQTAVGDRNVQVTDLQGSTVTVSFGAQARPSGE